MVVYLPTVPTDVYSKLAARLLTILVHGHCLPGTCVTNDTQAKVASLLGNIYFIYLFPYGQKHDQSHRTHQSPYAHNLKQAVCLSSISALVDTYLEVRGHLANVFEGRPA